MGLKMHEFIKLTKKLKRNNGKFFENFWIYICKTKVGSDIRIIDKSEFNRLLMLIKKCGERAVFKNK